MLTNVYIYLLSQLTIIIIEPFFGYLACWKSESTLFLVWVYLPVN